MTIRYEKMLLDLNNGMMDMYRMLEASLQQCSEVIQSGDANAAKRLVEQDDDIDQKERELETLCLRLLLTQHPVAKDMRYVSAALKMLTDMERIGDQAADIAEIILAAGNVLPMEFRPKLREMSLTVTSMLKQAVDAYVSMDSKIADHVICMDDEVDGLFEKMKNTLIDEIRAQPQLGRFALDSLMISKYFERIGDHAVNIAEWVHYAIFGEHIQSEN